MLQMRAPLHLTHCRLHHVAQKYGGYRAAALRIAKQQRRVARRQTAGRRHHVTSATTSDVTTYSFGNKVLQDGSLGEDVLELQRYLHDQGYFPRLRETPDGYTGYFGDLTTEALTAWQEDCHLIADGRFGQSSRQAVARQQEEQLLEHTRRQQMVLQAPAAPVQAKQGLSAVQVGGILFLLGGFFMFAYQAWSWRTRRETKWRHCELQDLADTALQSPNQQAMQDDTLVYDEPEERQQYRGKWQGTLTGDHSYARSSSSTFASSSSPSSSLPTHSRRPRSPGTYVALPNLNPQGNPSQASAPLRPPSPAADPSQLSDAAGPAVSLEGYPRYNPQWGTQLTEPKRTSSSVPTRREPSDRAKSVMTKPGTPAYKASAGTPKPPSRPRPDPTGHTKRISPEEAKHARQQAYSKRPRSPNPTAMPESLQKPPPLKPELDPSAKSWIQIAVGQRAPKDTRSQASSSSPGQNGSITQGSSKQGRQPQPNQATPGSPGSGVAQVLSVDEERLVDDRVRKPAQSSSNGNGAASSDSSGSGSKQKQAGGVSLFGSYKAPIKRE